jgi:protein-tyrosine phosphatase
MERAIALEGCLNFRDLGGYRTADGRQVRWRRLFRSDALHRQTPADVERMIDEIGLTTVIDLRTTAERERGGEVLVEGHPGVRALHAPLVDELFADPEARAERPPVSDMGEGYARMLLAGKERVAKVLGVLAEPGALPAVFFCSAGKDRTGALSGLVLGLLGVADHDIATDYELTDPLAEAILERARVDVPGREGGWDDLPPEARGAPAWVMESMLSNLRREHGSLEAFVDELGVDAHVVDRLRQELLELSPS